MRRREKLIIECAKIDYKEKEKEKEKRIKIAVNEWIGRGEFEIHKREWDTYKEVVNRDMFSHHFMSQFVGTHQRSNNFFLIEVN